MLRHLVVADLDNPVRFRGTSAQIRLASVSLGWFIAALPAIVSLFAGSIGGTLTFSVIAGAVWCAQYLEKAAVRRELDD